MRDTNFVQTETILRALEYALSHGGFGKNARQKKAAASLIKEMKSNQSVTGRHQQLAAMLKKGATVEQMIRASGSSRRTIFRYLNHFENAGMDITIDRGTYKLKDG